MNPAIEITGQECFKNSANQYKIFATKNYNNINCQNEKVEVDCPDEKLKPIICINPTNKITGTDCYKTVNGDYIIDGMTTYENSLCKSLEKQVQLNCPQDKINTFVCTDPNVVVTGNTCFQKDGKYVINAMKKYSNDKCKYLESEVTVDCPTEMQKSLTCVNPSTEIIGDTCYKNSSGNYLIKAKTKYSDPLCKNMETDIEIDCPVEKKQDILCKNKVLQMTGDTCYKNSSGKYVISGKTIYSDSICKNLEETIELNCPDDKLRSIVCVNPQREITGKNCDINTEGKYVIKGLEKYSDPVCKTLESTVDMNCPDDKLKEILCINPEVEVTGDTCYKNNDGKYVIKAVNRFSNDFCKPFETETTDKCSNDKLAEQICINPLIEITGTTCFKNGNDYFVKARTKFTDKDCSFLEKDVDVKCPIEMLKKQLCVNPIVTNNTCFKDENGLWKFKQLNDYVEPICEDFETTKDCPLEQARKLACVKPVEITTGNKCKQVQDGNMMVFKIDGKLKYSDGICRDLEKDILLECPRDKLKEVACVDPEFIVTGDKCYYSDIAKDWRIAGRYKYANSVCNDLSNTQMEIPCPIDKFKEAVCKNFEMKKFGDCYEKDGKFMTKKIKHYTDNIPACLDELIEVPCECSPGKQVTKECYYDDTLKNYRTEIKQVNNNCSEQVYTSSCSKDIDCKTEFSQLIPCSNNREISRYTITQKPFNNGKKCEDTVPSNPRSIMNVTSDKQFLDVATSCCTPATQMTTSCVFNNNTGKYENKFLKTDKSCNNETVIEECITPINCMITSQPEISTCSVDDKQEYSYDVLRMPSSTGKQCNTTDILSGRYDSLAQTKFNSDYSKFIQVRKCNFPFIGIETQNKKLFAVSYNCNKPNYALCKDSPVYEKKLIFELGDIITDEYKQVANGVIDGMRNTTVELKNYDNKLYTTFVNYNIENQTLMRNTLKTLANTFYNIPNDLYFGESFSLTTINKIIFLSHYMCTVNTPILKEECKYDPSAYTDQTKWQSYITTVYPPPFRNLPESEASRCIIKPQYVNYSCSLDVNCELGEKTETSIYPCVLSGDKVLKQIGSYSIKTPSINKGKICSSREVLGDKFNSQNIYKIENNRLVEYQECKGVSYIGTPIVEGNKVTISGKTCTASVDCSIFPDKTTIVEIDTLGNIEQKSSTKDRGNYVQKYNVYNTPLKNINTEVYENTIRLGTFPYISFMNVVLQFIKTKTGKNINPGYIDYSYVDTDNKVYSIWESTF